MANGEVITTNNNRNNSRQIYIESIINAMIASLADHGLNYNAPLLPANDSEMTD